MSAFLPIMEGLQVAVLGSGISGSTAARQLANAGVKVTVFESGRGAGGRTSTRKSRDEHKFSFDHGAQYIAQPKTDAFQTALKEWESSGCVKEWKGRFADVSSDEPLEAPEKPHYVGYPSMNSICKHLLDHENIDLILQTRACAKFDGSSSKWSLVSHDTENPLGQFDWLLSSDRSSATNNRADLRNAPVSEYKSRVESIVSVPSLTLMVAFESPLTGVPFDGIRFEEGANFGSLGWIARDTSKPGRERSDGRECWVVQSGVQAAKDVMASTEGTSFENTRENVREKAKDVLLADFLSAIPKLSSGSTDIPEITSAVGHRWSAAFPLVPEDADLNESYSDLTQKFVACGDYIGKLTGRIEGAYLSGSSAASSILTNVANEK